MASPPPADDLRRQAAAFRNLRIFQTGQALSNVGTFSQVVALSLLVLEMSDSGFALGVTMALQATPMLLLSPWSGALLDRLPLRRLMLLTALLGAAQALTLGLLAATGAIGVPWVFALALVLGVVQTFERPAGQAFLVELVPRSALPRAVSLAGAVQAVGRLGGPALAAVLYAWQGAALVFAVNAASYLAVVVALLLLRRDALLPRERRAGQRTDLRDALRVARRSPVLGPVLVGNAVVGLFAFNFPTFYATISTLTFEQPSLFGLAESINAAFAVLAGLVMARYLRAPTLTKAAVACLALGSALAWVALAPTPLVFLASMPYFGFVVVSYTTTSQALVQQHAPREMAGRMMSLYTLGTMGTTPLGGLIVGWVIDWASPRAAVGLGAGSALLVGAALLVLARLHARAAGRAWEGSSPDVPRRPARRGPSGLAS